MAKFFVGQRVRLAWLRVGCTAAVEAGATGRIVEIGPWKAGESRGNGKVFRVESDCVVQWDGGYGDSGSVFKQLEPILDQNAPCESDFKESLDKLLEGMPA